MTKNRSRGKTGAWAARQNRDQFVQKARSGGFRARSVYKLEQVDRKFRLIRPDTRLVDLGSAPGSWSQYAIKQITGHGKVVAVDLLPMQAIPGVEFIQGDLTDHEIIEQVGQTLDGHSLDLVLSDMAPNISGIRTTDQARSELLQESILMFCRASLRAGGCLLTKIFEGEAAITMRTRMKSRFDQFQTIKPEASRAESKEIFLLGRGYRGEPGGQS